MKDGMEHGKAERNPSTNPENARERMAELIRVSEELVGLSILRLPENPKPGELVRQMKDPVRIERRNELQLFLRENVSYLLGLLSDETLFHSAATTYLQLLRDSSLYNLRELSSGIAKSAPLLRARFEQYASHSNVSIELLEEARRSILHYGDRREPENRESIRKIEEEVQAALPALKLLLSSEKDLAPHARSEHLKSLERLLIMVQGADSEWITDELGAHILTLLEESETDVTGSQQEKPDLHGLLFHIPNTHGSRLVRNLFGRFGLPHDAYASIIDDTKNKQEGRYVWRLSSHLLEILNTMRHLESERPGSVRMLYERFGIRRFDRYSHNTLRDLYDECEQIDKPYVVLLTAISDNNDAFGDAASRAFYERLMRDLQNLGVSLRIVECGGKKELESQLERLHAAYGDTQKISSMIIQAHSSKDGLQLGDTGDDWHVGIEDIESKEFAPHANKFEDSPTFVFYGCSIGRRGGFAQVFSRVMNATVYAPKGIWSALTRLSVQKEKNTVLLNPEYAVLKGKGNSAPHVYVNGRLR